MSPLPRASYARYIVSIIASRLVILRPPDNGKTFKITHGCREAGSRVRADRKGAPTVKTVFSTHIGTPASMLRQRSRLQALVRAVRTDNVCSQPAVLLGERL